jgi:dipeptidyl-peptidase-4
MCRPTSACVALAAAWLLSGCAAPAPVEPGPVTFDYDGYRDVSRELSRFDPGGRITRVRWSDDSTTLTFQRGGEPYAFDLERTAFVEVGDEEDASNGAGRRDRGEARRRRGPARGRQRTRETSPDGQWVAVCADWNVRIEPVEPEEPETGDDATADASGPVAATPISVTTEGTRKLRYGMASWVYGEELRQTTAMWWAPDSRRLVFYEFDERAVPDFYLLRGLADLRTSPVREGYPKPGEPNPIASLLVYDLDTGETTRIDTGATNDPVDDDEEWYVYNVRFTPGGSEVLFNRTNRHQNVMHVEAHELDTGRSRRVVTETQETWQTNSPSMRFLDDGDRFLWETERDGVRQLELRHLDGRRLATLTEADRPYASVIRLDEDAGVLFYTAYDDADPLQVHLHRVNLDGTGRRRLTREPATHSITMSPDGRWFVTRYESITRMPTTAVYDATGRRLATLAESDPALADELGYPAPERFTCKADDGETDLYGWLYKPRGFDPARSYPLVIDVYGGPGSKGVRGRYRPGHAVTALDVIVAKIDNRGTGGRGKAFLGAVYRKLGIVDIADQAAGVRHLVRRPYIDADRVGIYGHSYGGYMAALAILKYPDLFHVAVAGAPVTDWRNYDTIYTERYMRTPEENETGYDEGSCLTYAEQLRGKLLILHGMMDDNVHPNNAFQLMDALQGAGKSFDVMFYPESGHGLRQHATRVRLGYLHRHLH